MSTVISFVSYFSSFCIPPPSPFERVLFQGWGIAVIIYNYVIYFLHSDLLRMGNGGGKSVLRQPLAPYGERCP